MKIWKSQTEPSSIDYIWARINDNFEINCYLKYINGKWCVISRSELKNQNNIFEGYDNLDEFIAMLQNKVDSTALANVAFSGEYSDLLNAPNQRTFKEFKSNWPTGNTLESFCSTVISDSDAKVGNAYLGGLHCTGLPPGMGQGDVVVEIIGTNSNKVVKLTLTSTDVNPYHWEGCYWQGSFRGWKTFELDANKVTSISSSSTDAQYPSARCVYNKISDIEDRLFTLENSN